MNILFLGPPSPALEYHLSRAGHNITRLEGPFDATFLESRGFDFGVSYRYRHIIRKQTIDWLAGRLINLHISYLPWNRGADPNLWSFLTQTPSGVSIHLIDEGIDTGGILLRETVEHTLAFDTLHSTYERLDKAITRMFCDNTEALLLERISPFQPEGEGSFHSLADKIPFQHLWAKLRWDTPVHKLWGKGVRS